MNYLLKLLMFHYLLIRKDREEKEKKLREEEARMKEENEARIRKEGEEWQKSKEEKAAQMKKEEEERKRLKEEKDDELLKKLDRQPNEGKVLHKKRVNDFLASPDGKEISQKLRKRITEMMDLEISKK
jgi:hypothetical protein